ncbi:hypothetical protein FHS40_005439 [Streptomyces spectabilis]|uniref:Class E sortase n=1 Tax=Streptomyces spectabilis TaxID=68270 RepID=A0A7W8AX78_STRST|nr:hypothetical protein [Streptomyces spectabilis]
MRGPRRSPLARCLWYAAELLVTLGFVLLLLVVHQLWWTNRQARASSSGVGAVSGKEPVAEGIGKSGGSPQHPR